MHNPLRSPAVILFDSEKENAMLDQVLQPGVRPQKLATRNNAVSYRNTGRFLDADAVFSSDDLAGGGPAAAHFLWSRPKISTQRKATATTSPLRGSRRCGVTIGRAANSLRSNMRLSSPDAYPTPPATQKRIFETARCALRYPRS